MGCCGLKKKKVSQGQNLVLATDGNENSRGTSLGKDLLKIEKVFGNPINNFNDHDKSREILSSHIYIPYKTNDINKDYILGRNLGAGGLGSVRIAIHIHTKKDRAVKTIKKSNISSDMRLKSQFFTEIDILRQTDHPNIVKLYEFYEDDRNFHLVIEHLRGKDLFSYLVQQKTLSEQTAAFFFKKILSAVNYCHSKGIVHRDLRLDHLLLESNSPKSLLKVIDFGTSAFFEPKKRLTRKYGTSYYIAPEVLNHSYTEKCDIWSCGVILCLLLSGHPPFDGKTELEIFTKIIKGTYSLSSDIWSKVSNEAKVLISKMLTIDPDQRITADQALSDPWLIRNSTAYSPINFGSQSDY